jgi:ribosomal protein S18 acetylase RimI-like enzyme
MITFKDREISVVTLEKTIKEITREALENSVAIIRRAFGTVAAEMGLTEETTPFFPAYTTTTRLEELRAWGAVFFGLFTGSQQVGFVALEKESDGGYYMKRLAVLPEYRHHGFGRELVRYVIDYVRNKGINRLFLAMVNEQAVLKNWYKALGFRETAIREFEHLPFKVCFMELDIV